MFEVPLQLSYYGNGVVHWKKPVDALEKSRKNRGSSIRIHR